MAIVIKPCDGAWHERCLLPCLGSHRTTFLYKAMDVQICSYNTGHIKPDFFILVLESKASSAACTATSSANMATESGAPPSDECLFSMFV